MRYLRAHADEFGIDADHIGAIGLSAGGHLTALLATSAGIPELEGDGGNADFSSRIQAAVPMGAQTDLLSERVGMVSEAPDRGEIWRKFLGGSQQEQPRQYQLASPLEHLDADDPPCWLIAGEHDDPSTLGVRFREQLQRLQVTNGMTVLPEAPHAFLNRTQWFTPMLDQAHYFFDEQLRDGTPE